MKKIAVIGTGNVGIAAAKEVLASPDMKLCGFVSRGNKNRSELNDICTAQSVFDLPEKPDGAIIAVPSRFAENIEKELLEAGIYTADCFDIHEELSEMIKRLDIYAKKGKVSAVIGAGWDPGIDSVIRILMSASFPNGEIHTNFGPGMSMGHSAAVKAIDGIKDAVSLTLPLGSGKHARRIYAVLEENADRSIIEHAIFNDGYFEHDKCSIEFVESVKPFFDTAHGVNITCTGADEEHNMKFSMKADNPSLTGRILVFVMRAAFLQKPGAYLVPEIPPKDFCEGWKKLV